MSRDGFIARWSRLKAESAAPGASTPEAQPSAAPPPEAAPPSLSAEEIAALPPVETLTAASDITPFLRKGVPALLRRSAMRRMWTLNPAIRDYVDDAMEYAMDWNTPGAIVGAGPLSAGDDAAAMVRRLFGADREPATPPAEVKPPEAGSAEAGSSDAAAQEAAPTEAQPVARASDAAPEHPPAATGADQALRAASPAATPGRRRHGGATPS